MGMTNNKNIPNINPVMGKRPNPTPNLNVKSIVDLINTYSLSCTWEQAIQCPCYSVDNSSPKIDCKLCHGQGWLYLNPRTVDIALLGDKKQFDLSPQGTFIPMSTYATPQITTNGIEQGIKPGDRITVDGWDTPQTYLFNVTQGRLEQGIFLPYKVDSITHAYIIDDTQSTLEDIKDKLSFDKETNLLKINDESLLNKTISLVLSVIKRFYVVAMAKELRYAVLKNRVQKEAATGYGNRFLTYNQYVYGKDFPAGNQVFKLPNQLILRRENLYFPDYNVIQNDNDNQNNLEIKSPVVNDINDILGS